MDLVAVGARVEGAIPPEIASLERWPASGNETGSAIPRRRAARQPLTIPMPDSLIMLGSSRTDYGKIRSILRQSCCAVAHLDVQSGA